MTADTTRSKYAQVTGLPWDAVKWTDGLWNDRENTIQSVTVPHLQQMFDSEKISHVVENFRISAGETQGQHEGSVFGDGDFYKWMEAAVYTAGRTGNTKLMEQIDTYISLIGKAQQQDGYISTKQIISEKTGKGSIRMADINDFEIYNFGHLFTAACLHKRVTGKNSFLDIAVKAAGYLEKMYAAAERNGEVKTAVCPSHYMGLVELYRTTGYTRFLALAERAVKLRDSVRNGTDDNQDRIQLRSHKTIAGHAVRANYLYAGIADLCAETGNAEYSHVLDAVWHNLLEKKLYITGGCGALYNGVSPYGNFFRDQHVHQAYGYEYQLPNITAYNETCANVGLVLWAYRMFLLHPAAVYFDIIEKVMLNVNLAAVSLDGRKFFYENMLRRTPALDYELVWPLERTEYITSYCCPPNLARTLVQSSEYAYTLGENTIWTGLYGASRAHIVLKNKADFILLQETAYPFSGAVTFSVRNVQTSGTVYLNIRIPFWVETGTITLPDGSVRRLTDTDAGSYSTVQLDDKGSLHGSSVTVDFSVRVRLVTANDMVEEDINQAAIMRGPLVYCMESCDVPGKTLQGLFISTAGSWTEKTQTISGHRFTILEGTAYKLRSGSTKDKKLYQPLQYSGFSELPVHLIPYYAWDNRGPGEMKIWLPLLYGR
jgi:uncharacterized protein